jgi:hypothetical protein
MIGLPRNDTTNVSASEIKYTIPPAIPIVSLELPVTAKMIR